VIAFSLLRTKRLQVRLRELTIGDTIRLCKMPGHLNEVGTTELLNCIVMADDKPNKDQVTDPRLWTVQERALVVGHYLSQTSDKPDFSIGENTYSTYLRMDKNEVPASINLGRVAENEWTIRPLLGVQAETIERLITQERIDGGRTGWWLGAMAAMLYPDCDPGVMDADLEEYIENKVHILKGYPERAFMELLQAFLSGCEQLDHFFSLGFSDEGIVWEVPGKPPARFQFNSAVSEIAFSVFGSPDESSPRTDAVLQPVTE
jgi:hypothetical protein